MHWIALPLPWRNEPPPPRTNAEASASAAAGAEAWWALRFTPRVALLDEAVLLEVSTTERLWGGRGALLAQVLHAWREVPGMQAAEGAADHGGPAPRSQAASPAGTPSCIPQGCGPTALVALAWLRQMASGRAHPSSAPGPQGLPLHTLTALRPHVSSLERMGCRTWGALRALPRAGVARRFGSAVLQALDQAWGDAPEAHPWLELPEQFAWTAELPALAESADALLWSGSRCLAALQGWLQARQQGALGVELSWRHDLRRVDGVQVPPTQGLRVRTAQATQDMAHLRRLLSENLARTALAAPASHISLRLLESAPLPHRSASLLAPCEERCEERCEAAQGEALHQLLERLSARLGDVNVQAPVLQADHRPECMQQWRPASGVLRLNAASRDSPATPVAATHDVQSTLLDTAPHGALLPPWLISPPRRLAVQGDRPCHHGLLRLLGGPHRFEAGWWDGADGEAGAEPGLALRDYFVAHNDAAGLVWVFRERLAPVQEGSEEARRQQRHRWFLHGVFG